MLLKRAWASWRWARTVIDSVSARGSGPGGPGGFGGAGRGTRLQDGVRRRPALALHAGVQVGAVGAGGAWAFGGGARRGMAQPGKPFKNAGMPMQMVELSDLVQNAQTGERMPLKEYSKIAEWTVLRVLDDDGEKQEMKLSQVIQEASELGLKAVMVARQAKPPVVKLMNLGRVMREKQKKAKETAKKQSVQTLKELRLGLNIGEHDLDFKLKQGIEFLEKGHKLKLFIQLKGADYHRGREKAADKLREIAVRLEEVAKVEQDPDIKGGVVSVLLRPGGTKTEKEKKSSAPPPPPTPEKQKKPDGA